MGDAVLDPEDEKLILLARAARARRGAPQGAAVRDADGRTYAAAPVELVSLPLTALQVAVAMAVSSGATHLEAVAVVGDDAEDEPGERAVRELGPAVPIYRAGPDGTVISPSAGPRRG